MCCCLGAVAAAVSSAASSSPVITSSTQWTSLSSDVITTASTASSAAISSSADITMPTTTQQQQLVTTTTDHVVSSSAGGGASDAGIMSKLSGLLSLLPNRSTSQPTVSSFIQPTSTIVLPSSSTSTVTAPSAVVSTTDGQVASVDRATAPPPPQVTEEQKQKDEDAPPPQSSRVVDPIALLNQMLSQSRPAATTTSSSSVNFLQSLTMLTKTVSGGSSSSDTTSTGDEVFMGSYGKLEDVGSFTTTWSDQSRETSPPVKSLDHETIQTTVTIPISLASRSMGPPSLQSIYAMSGILSVASCSGNSSTSASSPISISSTVLSSQSLSNKLPFLTDTFDLANDGGLSLEKFPPRPDSSQETLCPIPGLDIGTVRGFGNSSGSLPENRPPIQFSFRLTEPGIVRNMQPEDEFTERLRRKTSMRLSDGMASPPPFPGENRGSMPPLSRDRMIDEVIQPPPLEPALDNFLTHPPATVYHDESGSDPEYNRYPSGGFDQWEMGDHSHEEFLTKFPVELPAEFPMMDLVYQNQFQSRLPAESAPVFPRPEFYPEPRGRPHVPPAEEFRPRFRPMSRLPPPAAFSALRSPAPPPPEHFQRSFFARF